MNNFDDIKKVWLSVDTAGLPGTGEILSTIKRYRARQILKLAGLLLLILLLVITMFWVLFAYHSKLPSTRIGEFCFLAALFMLLGNNIRSLKKVSDTKVFSNNEFLLYLKNQKLSMVRYQRKTQKIGFAIASLGLFLYIFEVVHENLKVMALSYIAIIIWCCFSWFIIRPVAARKKTNTINKTIAELEKFSKQLAN